MTLQIQNIGVALDLVVRQGVDLTLTDTITMGEGGQPFDLTGCAIEADVRKSVTDEALIASFVVDIAPDPTTGTYTCTLPGSVSRTMRAGSSIESPESGYVWDSRLKLPDGRKIPLYYGRLRVQAAVTRRAP